MSTSWTQTRVAPEGTHHLLGEAPLYEARFIEVLKYHAPGLAPARDASGAHHIDLRGRPAYPRRFLRTFGFYEGAAAVQAEEGWHHVDAQGEALYAPRWGWCGNFQGGRCVVRTEAGRYGHITPDGRPLAGLGWRYAGDFRDGRAVVTREDGRCTHVDARGAITHGRWFEDLDVFHKGYARARDAAGWTHIDLQGRPASARRFASVEPFYNGQARVETLDGAVEVVDEQGRTLVTLRPPRRDPLHEVSAHLVSFWRCEAVFAAVHAGLFERLPLRVPDGPAARLLLALFELGLVEPVEGAWQATPAGALLREDHPRSLAAAARYWAREGRASWARLPEALRDAAWRPPDPFASIAHDPQRVAALHAALRPYAEHDYAQISEAIPLTRGRVIDAGGATGALSEALLRARPGLEALVLDRPEVVEGALPPADLSGRLRFVAGDLFAPWPAQGEAVVLARVLHDWEDAHAVAILGRARAALTPGGRLYVVELLRPEQGGAGGLLSLHLLLSTGGRERSLPELDALLARAGLRRSGVHDLPGICSVIEAAQIS